MIISIHTRTLKSQLNNLVLSIEPCSWIEACSWMKDIHQSLRAECSRFPCQANMAPIEIPTWVVSLVVS